MDFKCKAASMAPDVHTSSRMLSQKEDDEEEEHSVENDFINGMENKVKKKQHLDETEPHPNRDLQTCADTENGLELFPVRDPAEQKMKLVQSVDTSTCTYELALSFKPDTVSCVE